MFPNSAIRDLHHEACFPTESRCAGPLIQARQGLGPSVNNGAKADDRSGHPEKAVAWARSNHHQIRHRRTMDVRNLSNDLGDSYAYSLAAVHQIKSRIQLDTWASRFASATDRSAASGLQDPTRRGRA